MSACSCSLHFGHTRYLLYFNSWERSKLTTAVTTLITCSYTITLVQNTSWCSTADIGSISRHRVPEVKERPRFCSQSWPGLSQCGHLQVHPALTWDSSWCPWSPSLSLFVRTLSMTLSARGLLRSFHPYHERKHTVEQRRWCLRSYPKQGSSRQTGLMPSPAASIGRLSCHAQCAGPPILTSWNRIFIPLYFFRSNHKASF